MMRWISDGTLEVAVPADTRIETQVVTEGYSSSGAPMVAVKCSRMVDGRGMAD